MASCCRSSGAQPGRGGADRVPVDAGMSGPGEVGTVHAGEDVVGAGDAGVGDGRQPAGGPRSPSGRCTAAHRVEHCVHAVRDQPEHLVGQALAVRDHHPAAGRQKLATAAPDHWGVRSSSGPGQPLQRAPARARPGRRADPAAHRVPDAVNNSDRSAPRGLANTGEGQARRRSACRRQRARTTLVWLRSQQAMMFGTVSSSR
jgi:hypothetical protein